MSREEWDDLSWDLQETYLDGLDAEEEIPFSRRRDTAPQDAEAGPVIRENVAAGSDVIDLAAMKQELEASRQARRQV